MDDVKQDSEQTTKSETDLVEDDQQDRESTSLADPSTNHAASDSETLSKKKPRPKRNLHGEYDIYGQFIPYISEDVLNCTICGRQILASKYSSHLSRCMGYGRTSASRSS